MLLTPPGANSCLKNAFAHASCTVFRISLAQRREAAQPPTRPLDVIEGPLMAA